MTLSTISKLVAGVLLLVGSIYVGIVIGKNTVEPRVVEIEVWKDREKIVEVEVVRTVYVDRKVESVETRPDGTVIATTTVESSSENSSSSSTETTSETEVSKVRSSDVRSNYSLGLEVDRETKVRLTGGYRIIGPVHVRGSISPVSLLTLGAGAGGVDYTLGVSIDM